jgi:hypothetical protein
MPFSDAVVWFFSSTRSPVATVMPSMLAPLTRPVVMVMLAVEATRTEALTSKPEATEST